MLRKAVSISAQRTHRGVMDLPGTVERTRCDSATQGRGEKLLKENSVNWSDDRLGQDLFVTHQSSQKRRIAKAKVAPCSPPGNKPDDDKRNIEDGEDDAHYKHRNLRLFDQCEVCHRSG